MRIRQKIISQPPRPHFRSVGGRGQAGVALLELLVALGVASLFLTGAVLVAFGGQTASLDVGLFSGGLYRLDSHISSTTAEVIAKWDLAHDEELNDPDNFYMGESVITDITPCLKQTAGHIYWQSEKARSQNINLSTLVASAGAVKDLGGDCDPFPPSAWEVPSAYPISNPIFSGSIGTDVDILKKDNDRLAAVTTKKIPNEPTLWVVDVTDLDNVTLTDDFTTEADLHAVDITYSSAGAYAFLGGATTTAQKPFQIFDLTDPENIYRVASSTLPNTNHAGFEKARSIYFYDDRVYIGTDYMIGGIYHELHIFDAADPTDPVWEASINIDRNVNDIVVTDGLAYLATGPGGNNTVLKIYDINPASPTYLTLVGQYAAPTTQAGTALYILGDYIYLGRERPGGSSTTDSLFLVINVSDPANPVLADAVDLNINKGTAVVGVQTRGQIAFIVTSDQNPNNQSGNSGDGPFIMYNISDPKAITLITACAVINWSEKAAGMDMADNLIFVANESDNALRAIYDNPSACPAS